MAKQPVSSKRTLAEHTALVDDVLGDAALMPAQIRQWLDHTHQCAFELAMQSAPNHGVAAIFPIRLFGVLADLREFAQKRTEAPSAKWRAIWSSLANSISSGVLDKFSNEELLWLEYRRHVDGHPFQTGYGRLFPDGRERETFHSRLVGDIAMVQVKRTLSTFFRQHMDERAIIVAFAKRVLPGMEQLRLVGMQIEMESRSLPR